LEAGLPLIRIIIVQIDTDVSEKKHYDIPKHNAQADSLVKRLSDSPYKAMQFM